MAPQQSQNQQVENQIIEPWTSEVGSTRVTELFTESFGTPPTGVWSAPGRVNLIGEHVDYNGGVSVPIALHHRTFVALNPRTDRVIRAVSAQESGPIPAINIDLAGGADDPKLAVPGWRAYVVGVAKAFEELGLGSLPGFDIAVDSCVPYGAGLSSSAALECALAVAFAEFAAGSTSIDSQSRASINSDDYRRKLAAACVLAENKYAGANTGGMDQAASLRAAEGQALAFDSRDESVTLVPFDLESIGWAILVIDTRAPHSLSDGQYASRRADCETAARILQVETLAEVRNFEETLAALDSEQLQKRVRHVVTEGARTSAFLDLLEDGGADSRSNNTRADSDGHTDANQQTMIAAGKLLTASHESLRDDYEVSCPELDVAVEAALGAGASGARMTGGGFGGSAIALVRIKDAPAVQKAVLEAFRANVFNTPGFLMATAGGPAVFVGKPE